MDIISPNTLILSKENVDNKWDDFVFNAKYGHYTQTSLWAQAQKVRGWDSFRVIKKDQNGNIISGAQIFIRNVPFMGNFGYMRWGPVCDVFNVNEVKDVVKEVMNLCNQEKLLYLAIKPPDNEEEIGHLLRDMGFSTARELYGEVYGIIIDLNQEYDQILSRMSKTKRNAIHRLERMNSGLSVRLGGENDIPAFYQLHTASSKRIGFTPYSLSYYQKLWETFEPRGFLKLFLAEFNGEPTSALLTIAYKEVVTAYKFGWSGKYKNLFPNEAVYWAAIKWAKMNGFRFFDFGEIDIEVADAIKQNKEMPEWGKKSYNFFKLEFGGEIIEYPHTYHWFSNAVLNSGYRTLDFLVTKAGLKTQMIDIYRKFSERH